MRTRITELLGIEHPIFQAAMSWASSSAPLVIAVSNAGGLGVLGAGPMRPEDFSRTLDAIRAGTSKPFGVNIPLNGTRARELLDIAVEKKIPVMVASQGGPREHLPRFRAIGTKWLHVVASVEHAKKAEAAGVDALVVDGADAGGHPPPSNVSTLVLVRRVVRATPEASVHENYKRAVLAADVHDTCLVGPPSLPIRQLKNAFTEKFYAASAAERDSLFKESSLKKAALEGDVEWGKVEAGQSAGLVDDILPAAEIMKRLVQELEQARKRLASL